MITLNRPQAMTAVNSDKAGLVGLTTTCRPWAGRRGIPVHVLAPGHVATEMTAEVPQRCSTGSSGAAAPWRGEQAELDAALVFLASPVSANITGSTLAADGGMPGH